MIKLLKDNTNSLVIIKIRSQSSAVGPRKIDSRYTYWLWAIVTKYRVDTRSWYYFSDVRSESATHKSQKTQITSFQEHI